MGLRSVSGGEMHMLGPCTVRRVLTGALVLVSWAVMLAAAAAVLYLYPRMEDAIGFDAHA